MSSTIPTSELLPGDVLLYRGTAAISRAIQLLDGTDVSHAGLCRGNGRVAEALIKRGLVENSLQESVAGCEWVCARRLLPPGEDMRPVLDRATWYLNQAPRYAYEQVLLLAMICLTRRVKITPALRPLMRAAIDRAAAHLLELTETGDREPMICSEFVFRCYDEALPEPNDRYSLQIGSAAASRDWMAATGEVASRGVHRESMLARLAADAGIVATINDPKAELLPKRRQLVPSHDEVETLAERYVQEVAEGKIVDEKPDLRDLAGSVRNLALRVHDLPRRGDRRSRVAPSAESDSLSLFDRFFTTAADFVTPGDLLKTPSMQNLGKLA